MGGLEIKSKKGSANSGNDEKECCRNRCDARSQTSVPAAEKGLKFRMKLGDLAALLGGVVGVHCRSIEVPECVQKV